MVKSIGILIRDSLAKWTFHRHLERVCRFPHLCPRAHQKRDEDLRLTRLPFQITTVQRANLLGVQG